ncbi:MAG: HU family DNA-binding protein [Polyangia bacterium]|jgi:DNA-binding protein HU-beta
MKKSDLVDSISGKAGVPKAQVQQMVDDVFDLIADGLAKGEKIDLRGFGTFSVRDSAARTGRNPQTGEPIAIPARRVPGFKPGKELKEKVNHNHSPSA